MVVAILVCVAAVLVFEKTVVQPPLDVKAVNQYENAMDGEIDNFKRLPVDSLETSYFRIVNFAEFLNSQNKISEKEEVEDVTDFMDLYVPRFNQWAYSIFRQSVWNQNDLDFIDNRIRVLKNFNIKGNPIVSSSDKLELNKIVNILDNYHDARVLAGSTAFTGIPQAEKKISKADEYANDEYLSNNVSLVNSLRELREKIGKSHYYYVVSQVNKMQYYPSMSRDEFDQVSENANHEISTYSQNGRRLYGKVENVDRLQELANNYYNRADAYYEEQERREYERSSNYY